MRLNDRATRSARRSGAAPFAQLRELSGKLRETRGLNHQPWDLSMGMSHDFEAAIEEGATLVRLGTALFGPRE